jgi:Ser/Thr protein kinase RdoA (MazF antagonist)
MATLCGSTKVCTELQTAAWGLAGRIGGFEMGIAHGDFRPNNLVRLRKDGRLGLIDFEDVMVDAKHYDIAQFLGAPDPLFKFENGLREEYVEYFMERSGSYGGGRLCSVLNVLVDSRNELREALEGNS